MGGGEERILAEQVQEAPHQMREEGRELPWARPAGLLNHGLSGDNFGIVSKRHAYYAECYARASVSQSASAFPHPG